MTELHFGVFVLLSLLLIYQDWRVIIGASAVISVHTAGSIICRNPMILFGFSAPNRAMVLVHVIYVAVESAALCYLAAVFTERL